MLIPITISMLCGAIGYFKPIAGFGLFLLFNTGLGGVFDKIGLVDPKLGPLQPGTLAYVMAIFSMLLRKKSNPIYRIKPSFLLFTLGVFTGMALFSRIVELGSLFTTKIIWEIFYCLLWAPLFMAFQKMDRSQLHLCRRFVIFASGITAFVTILTVITGSQFLYDLLATRSEDIMKKDFIEARIIVHGLWTFMPLGIWFCFMELFKDMKKSKYDNLLYGTIAIVIVLSVIINLTRFMLLGLVSGMAFSVVAAFFVLPKHISRKIYMFAGIAAILGAILVVRSEGVYYGWEARYREAQIGGSIEGRLIRNEYVFSRLLWDFPLLGNKDYWSEEAQISRLTGDPHTFLNIWTSYGAIASLTFIFLTVVVFFKLMKIYILRKRYRTEIIYEWVFLVGFYIQFQWTMISGDYLFEVTVFLLIIFLADVDRLGNVMNHVNVARIPRQMKIGRESVGKYSVPRR